MMEIVLSYRVEDFEGPLDLLLQLIARNKMSIFEIRLNELVDQYLEHIRQMHLQDMDVASDFLQMASRLIYLKTVSLLPKEKEDADRLKEELTGELLEYSVCRQMASRLSEMTGGFDSFCRLPQEVRPDKTYALSHPKEVIYEAYLAASGHKAAKLPVEDAPFQKIVARKIVAVSGKIVSVLRRLWKGGSRKLTSLYEGAKSRSELVATFLAVLELCKTNRVTVEGSGEDTRITLNREKKHETE